MSKAIAYILNPEKTDEKLLVSSYGCASETAAREFEWTRRIAGQKGMNPVRIIARHVIQSFEIGEVTPELAHEIGKQFADEILGGKYEYVLTTHIDKDHVHNHLIFNAVDFVDYHAYKSYKRIYYDMREVSDRLCKENGLSVIPPSQNKGMSYKEYTEAKRGTSWKQKLKQTIDRLVITAKDYDNLADLLQTIYQGRFGNDILAVNQGVLSDICSYSTDKVAVSELNVRTYFSTENMLSGKAGSTEATSLPTTSQTTACHKGDTLISNIRPYFKKIVYCEDKCGCSTDVLCFTPSQPCYSAYLFSTLYADKFFAFMVAGSKGTKMPRGDKQQIMTYPVVLPSEEELAGFNTIASPLLEQIYSNRAENKRLSILRDTLLPKLMSGEIDVSAIQL